MDLEVVVNNLLELKQEGGYWDFKQEWYIPDKDDTDLLHDIICMANNLENRDAYIIIGVEDKTFNLLGVSSDHNRKNTQMIVDFLKDKKFAGDVRPTVKVQTICIKDKELDIIIISNTTNTPYYLKERYKGVHSNNIYTRIQDSNTAVDRSADIDKVEWLWKKRFGLLQTPIEKLEIYLKDYSNWVDGPYGEMDKYYKFYPEYTLKYDFDDTRTGYEYYLFFQTDSSPHFLSMRFYYHQTLLKELVGIALDGGRYITPCPNTDGIEFRHNMSWDIMFKYMQKDSFEFLFNEFLYNNEFSADSRMARKKFFDCILVFKDRSEREEFKQYVVENWEIDKERYIDLIRPPYIPELGNGYKKDAFKDECSNILILQKMLQDFRESNYS